jgi:hypothetical protein
VEAIKSNASSVTAATKRVSLLLDLFKRVLACELLLAFCLFCSLSGIGISLMTIGCSLDGAAACGTSAGCIIFGVFLGGMGAGMLCNVFVPNDATGGASGGSWA